MVLQRLAKCGHLMGSFIIVALAIATETVNGSLHNTNVTMSNSLVFWTNCGQDTHNASTRKTNAAKIFIRTKEPPPTDFCMTYPQGRWHCCNHYRTRTPKLYFRLCCDTGKPKLYFRLCCNKGKPNTVLLSPLRHRETQNCTSVSVATQGNPKLYFRLRYPHHAILAFARQSFRQAPHCTSTIWTDVRYNLVFVFCLHESHPFYVPVAISIKNTPLCQSVKLPWICDSHSLFTVNFFD